ncbi:LysR family transcriptional regulator [Priestia megaterium]|uniref:LysR family transcriptional regulator n=1 Tax=Priestia megaterium TaxID=1404 RepID=UPI002E1E2082|nr:LysR family transcriptional regulator [Priestia megaterium]
MNLHALRLFHTVAEKGNVTRAAEELKISQPAVTVQIKKLEKELGVTLLGTKGRGILLTPVGIQLAKQAKRLFSLESEIEIYIEQLKNGEVGKLRIVATYLPANFLIPNWIGKYKKKFPEVELELMTTNSQKAMSQLMNYEADIAFIGGRREFNELINSTQLFEDEMLFVVNKNHKFASKNIPLSQIVKEPFVFREKGSSSREKLLSLCETHNVQRPSVSLKINGLNEAIRTVIEGYGVTFVSSLEANEYIKRQELAIVNVNEMNLKNPISICTRHKDILSTNVQDFIKIVKSSINR